MITSSPVLQRLTSNSTMMAPRATALVNATTVLAGLPPPFPWWAQTPPAGIGGMSNVPQMRRSVFPVSSTSKSFMRSASPELGWWRVRSSLPSNVRKSMPCPPFLA